MGGKSRFKVGMVELGNEDWFSHGYDWRAGYVYEGLRERYPDMTLVFSAFDESREFAVQIPDGGVWDAHVYARKFTSLLVRLSPSGRQDHPSVQQSRLILVLFSLAASWFTHKHDF